MTLLKKQAALAWELRGHLWAQTEVIISLRQDSLVKRVRGYVVEVSPADTAAMVDDARWDEPIRVDLSRVLTVRVPHFHEDEPEPIRNRPIFRPTPSAVHIPGQLRLGGEPPPVSRRSMIAMQRAAGMLLSQELLDVIEALDRAAKGKQSVPTAAVADAGGWSIQGTVLKLKRLAELRLAFAVDERPYRWTPGE